MSPNTEYSCAFCIISCLFSLLYLHLRSFSMVASLRSPSSCKNTGLCRSCSVTKSCLTLWPHGLQHARFPCASPSSGICSNSCSLSQWCHPTILSSVVPFFSFLWSFSASGSFPMSQLFASGGQSIGASVSFRPMNVPSWFPLGLTGLISLLSKGLSRVFSSTTVWNHQFFGRRHNSKTVLTKDFLPCPWEK